MRIVSKTNNSKLVKGSVYEVSRIWNSSKNGRVSLKGLGTYSTKGFTQLDGTPLPQIDWQDPSTQVRVDNGYIKEPHLLKKGDIVVCRWDTKYLASGQKYKISDVNTIERKYGSGSSYKETKIKVEGFNRWLNPWRFRYLNQEEIRDLSLNEIFDAHEAYAVDKLTRKLDKQAPKIKNKIILGSIFDGILDHHRNNLSTLDWVVQKSGRKWDLKHEDIDPFLNLSLKEIIDLME